MRMLKFQDKKKNQRKKGLEIKRINKIKMIKV